MEHVQPSEHPAPPVRRVVARSDMPRVPFLEAPIRVINQLRRADADDAERGECDSERRRQLKLEAVDQLRRRYAVRRPLQRDHRDDRADRECRHHQRRAHFDDLVSSRDQQQRSRSDDGDEQHLTRHVEVHRLEDHDAAADQSGYLKHEPEIHEEPEPEQPRHAQARPRNGVQRLERRDALDDGKARQLDLDEYLDDAADDDEPQHREAERGAHFRRDDELARSDDGRTDDESGTEMRRGTKPSAGRIEKLAWLPRATT